MLNEVLGVGKDRLQLLIDVCNPAVDVGNQRLPLGDSHLAELCDRYFDGLCKFLTDQSNFFRR